MKFTNKVLFMQEGGPMPEEQGAPMPAEAGAPVPAGGPQGGEDPVVGIAGQLVDMLMQQVGDPQMVMAILQTAMEMVGQAAQPAAPQFQRRGGKMYRI
jgi:hypothetical protein